VRLAKRCGSLRRWGLVHRPAIPQALWSDIPASVRGVAPWQVASVLLPLCFLYDIFWVFLQPLLLGGPSVMVQACTTRMHAALLEGAGWFTQVWVCMHVEPTAIRGLSAERPAHRHEPVSRWLRQAQRSEKNCTMRVAC
jgi:hypothetical protein